MDPQPPLAPPSSAGPHHHHHQPHARGPPNLVLDTHHHDVEYAPRTERGSKGSSKSRAHDSVISHPLSPTGTGPAPPSPASTVSSAHHHHHRRASGAPHPQDAGAITYPPRARLDPEKALVLPRSPARVSASNPDVTAVLYDSGEYQEKGPEDKPVQLLFFLSGPCALLSLLITLWTLFALLIALLLQPVRLFSPRRTLSAQITAFLAPPLNLQLHLIYSCAASTEYSAPMLVVVHALSPFAALGVAIAAWTAAFFWFFSAILGDPAGQDGHNDGKESILGVRNWWERWLSRALR